MGKVIRDVDFAGLGYVVDRWTGRRVGGVRRPKIYYTGIFIWRGCREQRASACACCRCENVAYNDILYYSRCKPWPEKWRKNTHTHTHVHILYICTGWFFKPPHFGPLIMRKSLEYYFNFFKFDVFQRFGFYLPSIFSNSDIIFFYSNENWIFFWGKEYRSNYYYYWKFFDVTISKCGQVYLTSELF